MLNKGAIFDMDGLMIDSEKIVLMGYEFAMNNFGYGKEILNLAKSCIGLTYDDTRRKFNEGMGKGFDYDSFKPNVSKFVHNYFRTNGVSVKKGLFELLEALKQEGYRLCVATSTRESTAKEELIDAGILPHFEDLVGGDNIKNGKPAPDIFLEAARRISVEPENCIVFEDSINGIKAAYNAGMKPIMVPDMVEPTEEILPMIYRRFKSLDEAIPLIKGELK